jgi:hypothetical protein
MLQIQFTGGKPSVEDRTYLARGRARFSFPSGFSKFVPREVAATCRKIFVEITQNVDQLERLSQFSPFHEK